MKAHTSFSVHIAGPRPCILVGKTKAEPGTFAFGRAVMKVRRCYPWIGSTRVEWGRYDGSDSPAVESGTIYHN